MHRNESYELNIENFLNVLKSKRITIPFLYDRNLPNNDILNFIKFQHFWVLKTKGVVEGI